ncbi:MAG TPA: hypothetical protein VHO90_18035 [Bacteroidales bacterium]|nr:hypothetical protein [Bacteroidales bacterium]
MGKSEDNIITDGLRGKVGRSIVFRQFNGETIVSKSPTTSNRTATASQLKQRDHFQEGVIYGKTVVVTPELRAQYESAVPEGKSVYKIALADFLKAPKIRNVDVSKYTGQIGSLIKVRAVDDFIVKSVHIAISNSDGSLVEQGEAVKAANGVDWEYKATTNNTSTEGDKIVILASDLPGNVAESGRSFGRYLTKRVCR